MMESDTYEIFHDNDQGQPMAWRVCWTRPSRRGEWFILCRCFTRNDAAKIKRALETTC